MIMSDFKITRLPLESTGSFEKTIISYINGHNTLKKLYDFEPQLDGLKARIAAGTNQNLNRPLLVDVLKSGYDSSGYLPEKKVADNIDYLLDERTFCVTTGHQLNIFSGPLYVLFKLISTINLTEKLNKEFPDHHFVPVYWMATEDHDIDEINHINLFSKQISFNTSYKGKSGKYDLAGFDDLSKSVTEILGDSDLAKVITEMISKSYLSSKTLAEATRKWTNALLGKYGLVILDADDPSLKKQFEPVMRKELEEQFTMNLVNKAANILKDEFPIQVNPREINLFYIDKDTRNRIVRTGDNFEILNTQRQFTLEEIRDELNSYPERFSPNVLLRPIYQETILPNICYVGGPSELAYWLELKFLFDELKVTMPVLLLRNCAMIVDHQTILKCDKFGFTTADLFQSEDELIRKFLGSKDLKPISFNNSSENLSAIFDRIGNEIASVDQTLKTTVDSEKQKSLNSLKMIEEKMLRAMKKKEETEVNQIRKIKEKLFPNGTPQERIETLIPFYLKWGNNFIDILKNSFDPLSNQFTVIEEKE